MAKYYFFKKKKTSSKTLFKYIGIGNIIVGVFIFLYFLINTFSYQIFAFNNTDIKAPIPEYSIPDPQQNSLVLPEFSNARNWYPNIASENGQIKVDSYSISIPKINIDSADVSTIDYDLSKHLVQYFGTPTPSDYGTTVIYGHSTFPNLFNKKDYKTMFANLHQLNPGDDIFIKVKNITYTYKVLSVFITSPEDKNVFSQSYDSSYIKLVTCTPPGTVWKRLVVKAVIDKLGN